MTFKKWCCDCGLSEGDACTDLALALAHDEHAPENGMFEDYFSFLSSIIPEKSVFLRLSGIFVSSFRF